MENQSNSLIAFDTQLKTALYTNFQDYKKSRKE